MAPLNFLMMRDTMALESMSIEIIRIIQLIHLKLNLFTLFRVKSTNLKLYLYIKPFGLSGVFHLKYQF